ncbi:MAG: hypothetical protein OHK0018_00920 [Erythrobacter tepidarius]
MIRNFVRSCSALALACAGLGAWAIAAHAAEPGKSGNRGYVVGDGGVARAAQAVPNPGPTDAPKNQSSSAPAGNRLVIKTKSVPPVAEPQPIGVNEPGVNAISRGSGSGAAGQPSRNRTGGPAPDTTTPVPETQQGKGIKKKNSGIY